MVNAFLIIVIIAAAIALLFLFYRGIQRKGSAETTLNVDEDRFRLQVITEYINETFNNILRINLYELNLSKEEFHKKVRIKEQLRKALKSCSYGNLSEKNYVKDFIRDIILKQFGINESNINKVMNFENPKELSAQDKFEICMYMYKKDYGYRAIEKMIVENKLDEMKKKTDEAAISYYISAEDIERVYLEKVKKVERFEDRINIIVQRVYQMYKGFGVVDEIRDMKIDGVSGGVSGIPETFYLEGDDADLSKFPSSHDSVWIFFKGKTIHLPFLSFGSQKELMRICKNIYRYNNPGQLNETRGFMVNEMMDGSRIVVAIPPFCESWIFLVRKFDSIKASKPEELIRDKNRELPINTMKWLIRGCRVTALTGGQGTGKTTLLMSIVQFINATFTLRIQELAFELHLRKLYPTRNIISFRETQSISGQDGLNLQKKTDGTVNILGEIASAPVASWMIQMAQVASLFTLFTHHAKTARDLVLSIRNNLLQEGIFSSEKVAEKQVADVINFDIHLKSEHGHRFIERITEIIPIDQDKEYPDGYRDADNFEEKVTRFMDTMNEYFVRMTDRKTFEARDIIRFENGEYIAVNPISQGTIDAMMILMPEEDRKEFSDFIAQHWGAKVVAGFAG